MTTQEIVFVDPAEKELGLLLRQSVVVILQKENADDFLGWFSNHAVGMAPHFFKPYSHDAEDLRGFVSAFSRHIWNQTPLPGNHYLPRPLPALEPGALCHCDSKRDYQDCCAKAEYPDVGMFFLSMLPYVLDALTPQQRASLPYAELPPEGLGFVAETWIELGREQDAVKLLEGLFAQIHKLDERSEHCFDRLLACYDRMGNAQQKARMIEIGMTAANLKLRSAVMQRQCCILIDSKEYAKAWVLFETLRDLTPDDPSLPHLEVSMLIGQGDHQRAQKRASYWLEHLTFNNSEEKITLLEFFKAVAEGESQHADDGGKK